MICLSSNNSLLLLLLLLPSFSSSFSLLHPSPSSSRVLAFNTATALRASPAPVITGNNIDLTDALAAHANQKVQAVLDKYPSLGLSSTVHLSVSRNPSVKLSNSAELVVKVDGGGVVRSEEKTADMYSR